MHKVAKVESLGGAKVAKVESLGRASKVGAKVSQFGASKVVPKVSQLDTELQK